MLAKVYKDHDIRGFWLSEKLDGVRAYWDGGVTRGKRLDDVDFWQRARVIDLRVGGVRSRTGESSISKRLKDRLATGLWSRYKKPIFAPSWWLNHLPPGVPLDGELYIKRGSFQNVVSIVRRSVHIDEVGWTSVHYHVFDTLDWADFGSFKDVYKELCGLSVDNPVLVAVCQERLPMSLSRARKYIDQRLSDVLEIGGEGLILRHGFVFCVLHGVSIC